MNTPHLHSLLLLRIYLTYRLIVISILITIFEIGIAPSVLGDVKPILFELSTWSYWLFCLGCFFIFRPKRLTRSQNRISFLLFTDLIVMLAVIYSSGGPQDGLGFLVIITAATASFFLSIKVALGYAAIIAIALILQAMFIHSSPSATGKSIFFSGILGILVFGATIALSYLTVRIRKSDQEANAQAEYAEHLKQLSQHVVSRMQTGIIAIDKEDKIELINNAAVELLHISKESNPVGRSIKHYNVLNDVIEKWHFNPVTITPRVVELDDNHEIKISFARLESDLNEGAILYIEDNKNIIEQAQQLKLASLGQLTATIAHEVRNPLGAISHAAQLLEESPNNDKHDNRLVEIILQQSDRVNELIDNILQLSRRNKPDPQRIELVSWGKKFINMFIEVRDCKIDLITNHKEIFATVDPSQLRQVVTNLIENALRHGFFVTNTYHATIEISITDVDFRPYINVVDNGEGIEKSNVNNIFDPFFTTEESGTGLGLYISKELCEINKASLSYNRTRDNKSYFKIELSHPKRRV